MSHVWFTLRGKFPFIRIQISSSIYQKITQDEHDLFSLLLRLYWENITSTLLLTLMSMNVCRYSEIKTTQSSYLLSFLLFLYATKILIFDCNITRTTDLFTNVFMKSWNKEDCIFAQNSKLNSYFPHWLDWDEIIEYFMSAHSSKWISVDTRVISKMCPIITQIFFFSSLFSDEYFIHVSIKILQNVN